MTLYWAKWSFVPIILQLSLFFFNTNRSKFGSKIAELNGGRRTSRISQIFLAPVLSLLRVPESDTQEDWIPGMTSDETENFIYTRGSGAY